MKSDVFKLNGEHTKEFLLAEVERTGEFCGLSAKHCMQLRLLSEEMLSMAERVLNTCDNEFWLENSGKEFQLHLKSWAKVSLEQRDEILTVSTDNKNAAAKGLFGKISNMLENMVMGENSLVDDMGYGNLGHYMLGGEQYAYAWSMYAYQNEAPAEQQKADWDGLERSIIVNLADDVIIGVKSHKVDMMVKKVF